MSGVKCSGTELSLAHCRHDEEVACPEGGVRFGAGVACSESKNVEELPPLTLPSVPVLEFRKPAVPLLKTLGFHSVCSGWESTVDSGSKRDKQYLLPQNRTRLMTRQRGNREELVLGLCISYFSRF